MVKNNCFIYMYITGQTLRLSAGYSEIFATQFIVVIMRASTTLREADIYAFGLSVCVCVCVCVYVCVSAKKSKKKLLIIN